jgi:hypothetical protein
LKGLGWAAAAITDGLAGGPFAECETRGLESECSEVKCMQVK